MNLREGMRRLGLLLGVLGAIAGGFASYMELQTVPAQRAAHRQFEQLANSAVVQQERKAQVDYDALAAKYGGTPVPAPAKAQPAPAHRPWEKYQTPQEKLPPAKTYLDNNGNPIPAFDPSAPYQATDAPPLPSEVDKGGIGTINWSRDYGVESIETQDGQTLYPTPAPSAWLYLLTALFPILGFLIPWGAIRAMGWVGAGFTQSSG